MCYAFMITEDYKTIESVFRAPEMKIKGSRFIANIYPVESKIEVEHALDNIRKEFYDASHNCYAYRLGPSAEYIRAADDGEPSGTAGRPILLMLTNAGITNILLVVTRYFGGTLLGTGGLARAYADSAQSAIVRSTIKAVLAMSDFECDLAYEDLALLQRLLPKFEASISESIYDERVRLRIAARLKQLKPLKAALIEHLSGRVNIRSSGDT
jgi:uncharacterized YigZ family protein